MDKDSISIKDYVDVRLEAINLSINLAKADLEKYLAGLNEFRNRVETQLPILLSRSEIESIYSRLQNVELSKADAPGHTWSIVATTIAIAVVAITFIQITLHYFIGR